MIFELCLSSHHQRPWAQRRQWHNNWLALLFGLVSWCAWPHRHPGPRLSFFQGCWFLCTSLSWTVQTNATYLHSCFQAVECLLVHVAVSLSLWTKSAVSLSIFLMTVLWLVSPSHSQMLQPCSVPYGLQGRHTAPQTWREVWRVSFPPSIFAPNVLCVRFAQEGVLSLRCPCPPPYRGWLYNFVRLNSSIYSNI